MKKRYVSKDNIKDQIQGGQQLDLSTLNINVTGTHSIIIVDQMQLLILKKLFQVLK